MARRVRHARRRVKGAGEPRPVSFQTRLRRARMSARMPGMDPHARAVSCWYRVAGLVSREQKDLAVEIIEAEIRSAQHEVLLDAASLCSAAMRSRSPGSCGSGRSGSSGRRDAQRDLERGDPLRARSVENAYGSRPNGQTLTS